MKVLYFCDGNGCRGRSCGGKPTENTGGCQRTTRPEHAINGMCNAPEQEPERFVEIKPGIYAEKVPGNLHPDNKVQRHAKT